jgi:hypothetical protein
LIGPSSRALSSSNIVIGNLMTGDFNPVINEDYRRAPDQLMTNDGIKGIKSFLGAEPPEATCFLWHRSNHER